MRCSGPGPGRRPSDRAASLWAGVVLSLSWAVTLVAWPLSDERVTDVPVYAFDASRFLAGALPYRDVPFEYPPLAGLVIASGGIAGTDYEAYRAVWTALMLAAAFAVLVATGRLAALSGGDRRRALLAVALAPLVTGAMIRTHFDLVPVALTLAALAALLRHRPAVAFALLGAGAMVKGFPLLVVPLAVAWLLARGEARSARRGLLALAATLATLGGAGATLSPGGALDAVRYHLERPVQVESAPATVLWAIDAAGGEPARLLRRAEPRPGGRSAVGGSDDISHPAAGATAAGFAALLVAALGLLTAAARRPPPCRSEEASARALILGSLAAVAAFAALGKVLSPQYLLWVVPLSALALAWRLWPLAAATAAAIALTLVEFPVHYSDLLEGEPWVVAAVAARNAALLAAVALAVHAAWGSTARRPAAAPPPARLGPQPALSSRR